MELNISDIFVFILSIPALWLLGRKKKISFVIFTFVNVLMISICIDSDPILWGVMAMQFVYIGFNVRNYVLWAKSEKMECK